ncbi:MAG: hypothetical protein ACTMH4_15660, partial [Sphingobacterium sp.]
RNYPKLKQKIPAMIRYVSHFGIIKKYQTSIILLNSYVDDTLLTLLRKRNADVTATAGLIQFFL